jgi:hypothetical protein
MVRFAIVISLLVSWFAAQAGSLPHRHGAGGDGHALRPHVHLGGHSHPHVHPVQGVPEGTVAGEDAEHDGDAIYLADATVVAAKRWLPSDQQEIGPTHVAHPASLARQGASNGVLPFERDIVDSRPPRFLMLRTLRI